MNILYKKTSKASLALLLANLLLLPASFDKAQAAETIDVMQSLQNAYSYSPHLKSVLQGQEKSQKQIRQAEAEHYPTITFWGGAGAAQNMSHDSKINETFDREIATAEIGLNFSLLLYAGGRVTANVKGREYAYETATFTALDASNNLAAETIAAHIDIIRRAQLVKLAEKHIKDHQRILSLLRSRVEQGLSTQGEVDQVLGRLNSAKATKLAYEEAYEAARYSYKKLTGTYPQGELLPVNMPNQMYKNFEEVRELALRDNYQVRALLAQVNEVNQNVDAAKSAYLPQITFDAGPSYTSEDTSGDKDIKAWDAMINFSWNLYNGGADKANVEATEAGYREAKYLLVTTKDALAEQVKLIYKRYETAIEQNEYHKKALRANNRARDNFTAQFEVGKKDLLSVLDAETASFASSVEEVITAGDAIISQYQLHAIAATLFTELSIDPQVKM